MTNWLAGLSVYGDRRVIAIFLLGIASGLPLALTGQTLQAWLTDRNVSLATIGLFAAVGVPYSLKFLWAPAIDRLRLPVLTRIFGRRRGWIIVTQALVIAAMLLLGSSDPVRQPLWTAAAALLLAFASASQDIVIDAWRVEILEERELAAGAASIVFGYRVGMLASGAGGLFLATVLPWPAVYAAFAALMLVGTATIITQPEPPAADPGEEALRRAEAASLLASDRQPTALNAVLTWFYVAVVAPLKEFASRPGWIVVLAFVLLFKFGDALAGSMATTFYLQLGFGMAQIATVVKIYGFGATLLGLFLGGWLMNAVGLVPALWIGGILQTASNLSYVWLNYVGADVNILGLSVGIENLTGGLGTAALVAYLSALCNVSYTATQYALLSSLTSVGRTVLSTSAGFMVEQIGWSGFFLASTAAGLPALLLLAWLTRHGAATRPNLPAGYRAALADD